MAAALIAELIKIDGVGEKKARDLIAAGLTAASELRKYSTMLSEETKLAISYPIDTSLSWEYVNDVINAFKDKISARSIMGVGGYRRRKPILHDIDMISLIPLTTVKRRLDASDLNIVGEYASGEKKLSIVLRFDNRYCRVDIFRVLPEEKPFALLHYTGSRQFNIRVRAHAKSRGYKLNQFGLFNADDETPVNAEFITEHDVLHFLGVTYVTPKNRNE